jgi:hypothetical protein
MSDPDSTWSQKGLQRILKQKEKALLVFADESGFSIHPKLGGGAMRGSEPTVPTTSQHHKRLSLRGWVEPVRRDWHLGGHPKAAIYGHLKTGH